MKKLALLFVFCPCFLSSFAQGQLDSLRQLVNLTDIKPNQLEILNQIAWGFQDLSLDSSLYFSDKVIEHANLLNDYPNLCLAHYQKGVFFDYQSNFDSSIYHYRQAVRISQQHGLQMLEARCYNSMGVAFYYHADLDSSYYYYDKAIAAFESINNLSAVASVLYNVGISYEDNGEYLRALKNYLRSLRVIENLDQPYRLINTLIAVGGTYKNLKSYNKALFYFQKADSVNQLKPIPNLQNVIYANFAHLYMDLGLLDSANYYIEESLKGLSEEETNMARDYYIYQKTRYAIDAGNFKEAQFWIDSVHNMLKREAFPLTMQSEMIYEEARFNFKLGRPQKAIAIINKALSDSTLLKLRPIYEKLYGLGTKVYEALGETDQSLTFYKMYIAYKDSMLNVPVYEEIIDLQSQYESEKGQEIIDRLENEKLIQDLQLKNANINNRWLIVLVLLLAVIFFVLYNRFQLKRKSVAILSAKNKQISEALEEREILHKELHHRVKNNLQIISSMLELKSPNSTADDILKQNKERIYAMAAIHEMLYKSGSLNKLSFKTYLDGLISYIEESLLPSNKNVKISSSVNETQIDLDKMITCGLIINEVVTNSLKYAFEGRNEGQISISFSKQEDGLGLLQIQDDGPGYKEEQRQEGLGTRLIAGFVNQLNGQLWVDTESGVQYQIAFQID